MAPIIPAAQRLCASRTKSGLGYTILREGAGAKPGATDTVMINYIGYLAANGAVFDQGMQSALPVDKVISGFSQGMQMAARTGIIRLCIPASLGYGATATGPIPANSDLVFQVELIDIKTAAEMTTIRMGEATNPATGNDAEPQK
ncbi:FKBP-type peptidyl-prolyl cis-trans isomerase [Sphingomonas panacisoli]|uniref:FKBP-type peptidyl-prolyl cis-trans isomerase n=1 Tax=Sphingomonas panacisoli TaxID=1813879 RepID=UPI00164528F1|nr:FKBP-type peptidyl-prolyl cis-trans isomerase [Sphingomonas panacisoli]